MNERLRIAAEAEDASSRLQVRTVGKMRILSATVVQVRREEKLLLASTRASPLCRKYAIVIRNHARHDIEQIRTLLDDLKSPDAAVRRAAPRPIWITGYGGTTTFDKATNTYVVSNGQGYDEPRNELLSWHVENHVADIELFVAENEDEASPLYHCKTYKFSGEMRCLKGDKKANNLIAIKEKFNPSPREFKVLNFRRKRHFRYYLGPMPRAHPDFYVNGVDTDGASIGTHSSINEDDPDLLVASSPAPLPDD